MKVLIVDDSLTIRMDLKDAFETEGFLPTLCETAAAARTELSKSSFHLIVLDVLLPDADGIDFIKELKSKPETAKIPTMVLSTETEVHNRVRGLSIGAANYVGKPYDRSYLIARAKELTAAIDRNTPSSAAARILVIDDSRTYRESLKTLFESAGYQVLLAETGEQGLRVAAHSHPAVIVVDGNLPGIDGATVVRRIRSDSSLRSTPCFVLTASGDQKDELLALDAGADIFVRKDEELTVLLTRVALVLRSGHTPVQPILEKSLFSPKTLLAVDDSPTYLNRLVEEVQVEGYEIILARSGQEALDLLAIQTADCILLDVVMPGLSGPETCRRIKAIPHLRDIPLLLLTAKDDAEAMLEGFNAGADDYISKSSEFEVLRARVRAQIRRKQFEVENRRIREELAAKARDFAEAAANRITMETQAKLLEQLENANRELDSFSYSVSHDLRAPLRAIDGFSKILLGEYSHVLDTEGQRLLKVICDRTREMGTLINDLLAFSRVGKATFQKSEVDLTDLVQSVVDTLKPSDPNRPVSVTLKPLDKVYGDPSMLRHVFTNLISNALKFTGHRKNPVIEIGSAPEGDEIVFYIKDNGAGFDMQYANKLFGVFQRLHDMNEFEGTGVGLAIVKRVVERHGGRVWAEGKVDQGAAFYFTLSSEGKKNGTKDGFG